MSKKNPGLLRRAWRKTNTKTGTLVVGLTVGTAIGERDYLNTGLYQGPQEDISAVVHNSIDALKFVAGGMQSVAEETEGVANELGLTPTPE